LLQVSNNREERLSLRRVFIEEVDTQNNDPGCIDNETSRVHGGSHSTANNHVHWADTATGSSGGGREMVTSHVDRVSPCCNDAVHNLVGIRGFLCCEQHLSHVVSAGMCDCAHLPITS
jgi:hypothetical protein